MLYKAQEQKALLKIGKKIRELREKRDLTQVNSLMMLTYLRTKLVELKEAKAKYLLLL